jgi:hypothetical protein
MATKQFVPSKTPIDGDLRDAFATAALQGLVTRAMVSGTESAVAREAYMLADAMLAEKTKTSDPEAEPL